MREDEEEGEEAPGNPKRPQHHFQKTPGGFKRPQDDDELIDEV